MRSFIDILKTEESCCQRLDKLERTIMSVEREIREIEAIPIDAPCKARDLDDRFREIQSLTIQANAAHELLCNARRDIRNYLNEILGDKPCPR